MAAQDGPGSEGACLGLPCLALMMGHANVIEEAVKLANDGVDLLGQIAGVHGARRPAATQRDIISMSGKKAREALRARTELQGTC